MKINCPNCKSENVQGNTGLSAGGVYVTFECLGCGYEDRVHPKGMENLQSEIDNSFKGVENG